jgi:TetR/AcrR family transcriptional regulator, cholesterol catabolism regulator
MTSAEVASGEAGQRHDRLLDVIVDILETDGYDAVQLREVARRARTLLATIYERYATRDEMIAAALERAGWKKIRTQV